jgi:predicted MFS family arabinose efflux permease
VRRDPNPHVGFGGPGPHFCLGAHLARRELAVVFRQLLTRLPDLEVTGPPEYLEAAGIPLVGWHQAALPVRFTPTAFAPSGPVLGVALFAMGLGGAVIWIPSPAISARILPPHRAGMAVGLVGSGIGVGLVFAGQTAAWLDRRDDSGAAWQTLYRIEFTVAIVVLIGAFVVLRSRGDRPALAGGFGGVRALRTVRAWIPATVAYAAYGFGYILVLAFLVARLEDDAGFSSGQAAAMFSIVGVAAVFGGLTLGPLSDRLGRRNTLTGAFVLFAACTLLVLTGRQPWVALGVVGVGLVFSGAPALIIAHIVDHTDSDTYGPAFSAATLAFGVAQMVSPQIGGTIADWLGSFTWVFALSAVLSAVGAVASSRLPARGR